MTRRLKDDLDKFVEGHLTVADLQTALDGLVRFRYADRDERLVEGSVSALPTTRFSSADVERVLHRFLKGELSRREVSDWAATLRLLDAFELALPSHVSAEAVWDVLDQLMSPDAWDELTTEATLNLLARLERSA